MHRKNKSIKVDGNSYRKNADTVPAFGMRHYYNSDNGDYSHFNEGITIYADDGQIGVFRAQLPVFCYCNGE